MGQTNSLTTSFDWNWELCANREDVYEECNQKQSKQIEESPKCKKKSNCSVDNNGSTTINALSIKEIPQQITSNDATPNFTHKKRDEEGFSKNTEISKNIFERKNSAMHLTMSFVPAGSTIPRAPPGRTISTIINQHGLNSAQTARAYASSSATKIYTPVPNSYWNANASTFRLRSGTNYRKNKQKAPSAPALYDLYCFDIIALPDTMHNVEDRFQIPDIPGITDIETGHKAVPPMLVIIANLPKDEPKLVSSKTTKNCLVAVFYFIISEATLEALKDLNNASPAAKLFVEWCKKAETDDEFRGRFKAMAVLDEIENLGLPSFISGYNGKPVLINKSGTFKRHKNYIEMSINVFLFHFIARKTLYSLQPKFPTFVLNMGFTIEGRSDAELPEVLLGGCRLLNIDTCRVLKFHK